MRPSAFSPLSLLLLLVSSPPFFSPLPHFPSPLLSSPPQPLDPEWESYVHRALPKARGGEHGEANSQAGNSYLVCTDREGEKEI